MRNSIFIPKYIDPEYVNEDAVGGKEGQYAVVSDGAGGGGVYADKWAGFLVEHLPEIPFCSFEEMDGWVDGIWEEFYQKYEEEAKKTGGLLLEKFYKEGSFATVAAVWMTGGHACQWATYGDSVVFCYHKRNGVLEHSFKSIVDFNNPPYLINYNDKLKEEGFRCGSFELEEEDILFVASDTLSHYIIMMYEVSKREEFGDELQNALNAHSKNSNAIKTAMALGKFDFKEDVLEKLLNFVNDKPAFQKFTDSLRSNGLLLEDDYSLVLLNSYVSEKSRHLSLKNLLKKYGKSSKILMRKSIRKLLKSSRQ